MPYVCITKDIQKEENQVKKLLYAIQANKACVAIKSSVAAATPSPQLCTLTGFGMEKSGILALDS